MINTFFIGDTHFGHKNIIGFNRPEFDDLAEMHECMIERWNAVVRPKDIVYHLGDFAFGKTWVPAIAPQLNGTKHLILGNHEHKDIDIYKYDFKKLFGCTGYKQCILTHIPIHPQQFFRWKLNIHGHVHHKDEELMNDRRYFNVCADHINLTPIAWEDIKAQRKELW